MWRVPRRQVDLSSRPAQNHRGTSAVFSRVHHDDVPVAGHPIYKHGMHFHAPARPHKFVIVETAGFPVAEFETRAFDTLHGRRLTLTCTTKRGDWVNMDLRLLTPQANVSQSIDACLDAGREPPVKRRNQSNSTEGHSPNSKPARFTTIRSRPRKSNPNCLTHPRIETGTVRRPRSSRSYSTWTMRLKGPS